MSIASEIQSLATNLGSAKNAVITKGGTTGDTGLAGLANEIMTIPSGGGSSVYSYPEPPQDCAVEITYCNITPTTVKIWLADPPTVTGYAPPSFFEQYMNTSYVQDFNNVASLAGSEGGYNMKICWDSANGCFCLEYYTANNDWNVLEYFYDPIDLEGAGVFLSQSYFDQDTDVIYAMVSFRPYLENYGFETSKIHYGDTAFTQLLSPMSDTLYSWESGMTSTLPNLITDIYRSTHDGYGTYTFKDFIVSINFGAEAVGRITSIGDGVFRNMPYLMGVYNLPEGLTSVGTDFLDACASLTAPVVLPSTLSTIGSGFMSGCYSYNQPLDISHTTSIGDRFLRLCESMTSPINIGSVPASAINGVNCFTQMWSLAPAYQTGMTLQGTTASAWKQKFPDSSRNPYRKLIVAS